MRQGLKTIFISLLDPKSIVLGFALFNFILIWVEARNLAMSGIACVVCPWYDPWSYGNEPTRLLIAASLLRLSRVWAYVVTLALTGYMIGRFVYLVFVSNVTLLQEWTYLRKYEPYIVGSWDSQYLLGLIVFCFAGFYLVRDIGRTNSLRRTADNNSLHRSAGQHASQTCS